MGDRKYKQLTINVSLFEWKQFVKFRELGFSAREVLEYSSCPCDKCKGVSIIAYGKEDGEEILIPKGILSKRK